MNLIFLRDRRYVAPDIDVVETNSLDILLNMSGTGLDPYEGENLDN